MFSRLIAKVLTSSFISYVIGGCIAASAHLAIVVSSIELSSVDVEDANSLGFILGVLINYTFQRQVTFRRYARAHLEQLPLFICFSLIGLGINRIIYAYGIHEFQQHHLIAAATAILAVFFFNFSANSLITFRPKSSTPNSHSSASTPVKMATRKKAQT